MTPRPLLLVGAGGLAREAAAAVQAVNACQPTWDLLGFLDDDPARHGRDLGTARVLGPVETVADHPDAAVLICTGRPDNYVSRRALVGRLALPDDRFATLVHPAASLGHGTQLGPGSVVLAGVVATVDVRVGRHVALMPHVVLTHDDVLLDFVTIASRVALAGGVLVETGAYVGAGALVRENHTVGAWSLVGMGSLVTTDIPAGETWYGMPARRRGTAPLPAGFAAGNRS